MSHRKTPKTVDTSKVRRPMHPMAAKQLRLNRTWLRLRDAHTALEATDDLSMARSNRAVIQAQLEMVDHYIAMLEAGVSVWADA